MHEDMKKLEDELTKAREELLTRESDVEDWHTNSFGMSMSSKNSESSGSRASPPKTKKSGKRNQPAKNPIFEEVSSKRFHNPFLA